MNSSSYFMQTNVYFKKIVRISVKEKFWKFICFAAIIGFIVAAVLGKSALSCFENAHSTFFTITSACIWIGIFNSIQSICKEHDIIRSEYRAGMNLASYVMAHVRWQFLLTLMESIVVYIILLCFGVLIPEKGSISAGPIIGYFVTIYLLTFASSIMGLMVSSISGTPTTAMTIMPFVLIVQLVMSGVLFALEGISEKIAYVTYSKWGMSAFGRIADINNRTVFPDQAEKIRRQLANLPVGRIKLPNTTKPDFDPEFGGVLLCWLMIILIAAVCVGVTILSLKIKNRDS